MYELDPVSGYGECRCRDSYVFWYGNGECYKTFTPGPCQQGQFIVPSDHNPNTGRCVLNPCPRAHLFFPESNSTSMASFVSGLRSATPSRPLEGECYKVGSRGPCPLGELVVFERYSGKSFKGECGCSAGYNQNYWPETGQCFEWYTQGPCKDSFLFAYNRDKGQTECICDEQEGYVFWNETGKCYRVYSQGPCPNNAWLIPAEDLSEVFCECKTGFEFSPELYKCRPILPLESLGFQILPYLDMMREKPRRREVNRREDPGEPRRGVINWTRGIFVTPAGQKGSKGLDDGDILGMEKEPKDIPKRLISNPASALVDPVKDDFSSYERSNYRSRRRNLDFNHQNPFNLSTAKPGSPHNSDKRRRGSLKLVREMLEAMAEQRRRRGKSLQVSTSTLSPSGAKSRMERRRSLQQNRNSRDS